MNKGRPVHRIAQTASDMNAAARRAIPITLGVIAAARKTICDRALRQQEASFPQALRYERITIVVSREKTIE